MNVPRTLSLQQRIVLSVVLGLATILLLFGLVAFWAVQRSTQAVFQERLLLTRLMAAHIDGIIGADLDILERTAARPEMNPQPLSAPVHDTALREAAYQLVSFADLVLLDARGAVVWAHAQAPELLEEYLPATHRPVAEARTAGRAVVEPLPREDGDRPPLVCLAVPVRSVDGSAAGVLMADVDPFSDLALIPSLEDSLRTEVLDQKGRIVRSSRVGPVDRTSEHLPLLVRPGHPDEPRITAHEVTAGTAEKNHIVAYAPIARLPGWGVTIEQDEDLALALPTDLQRTMALFGVLALGLASFFAWVDTRRIVRPLRALTAASERIAAGDLATPITIDPAEEVGTLARTLESMRRHLRTSQAEVERWNHELEARVEERTRELQAIASDNARLLKEVQQKEAQRRQLLDKCLWAQEEERKRVARELHDEIGQGLTALVMGLASAEETLPAGQPRERLGAVRELTSGTLAELRRVMLDLRPSLLDDLGLPAALGWYLERHLDGSGVRYELALVGLRRQDRLPPRVETVLFRVVQEAVTNTLKHAGARTLTVRLRRFPRAVTVQVCDDGRGFEPLALVDDPEQLRGLGLLGMEERVGLLGGRFRLRSQPGRGTWIWARVPLETGEAT